MAPGFCCQLVGPTSEGPEACGSALATTGTQRYIGLGEGSYTFTVTARDAAGNASAASFSWPVDQTPPAITFGSPSPAANPSGWNNTGVSVAFTVSDALSGVATVASSSPLVLSAEGAAVTGWVTATDRAGNSSTVAAPSVKIDKTPPTVTITTPSSGAVYAIGTAVMASYSCADALSGVAGCTGPTPSGSNIDTGSIGSKTFTVNATDNAGNAVSQTVSYSVVNAADLVETAVSNPPTSAGPGASFSVTDTVKNQGRIGSGASITRYYLSVDGQKSSGALLLAGSRSVPSLAVGSSSKGTVTVIVPSATPLGAYFLLACADATNAVLETNETNNCLASAGTVQVTLPDLVETTISNPPSKAALAGSFKVTDTVKNQGLLSAAASTTRYYLSLNQQKDSGDILLTGSRSVPRLPAGGVSTGCVTVTIPSTAPLGTYFLVACADDLNAVTESSEANNCIISTATVVVH